MCDEFSLILEEAGAHKTFSLYSERRFTRLGYQSGAVYDCIPYFKKLLAVRNLNNLLVRACKLYLENDFILAASKALVNFTHRVTMPFLNAIERCTQEELIEILPNLC